MTEGEQAPLWTADQVDPSQLRGTPGPVERATRQALAAAALPATADGPAAALCALAWAIDAARAAGKFYGVAQAGPPYLDAARALGLTIGPTGAPTGAAGVEAWLASLDSPS